MPARVEGLEDGGGEGVRAVEEEVPQWRHRGEAYILRGLGPLSR